MSHYAVRPRVADRRKGMRTKRDVLYRFYKAVAFFQGLLSAWIGYQTIKGDEKYTLIRDLAIAFAAIIGTSFRDANLTDADFTNATLKSTDFR